MNGSAAWALGRRYRVGWIAVALGAGCAAPEPAAPVGVPVADFAGRGPGAWTRMEPRTSDFPFEATAEALTMRAEGGANQHLVRDGVIIDSTRAYAIEVDFTILVPLTESPNSFAINFNQAGADGDTAPVSCMSLNLDLGPGGGGVIKTMGFVDGRFHQLGERVVDWAGAGTEYRYRIEVEPSGLVAATIAGAGEILEAFEVDYAGFPYQVSVSDPGVRFGLNSHGASWRVSRLSVDYLEPSG